jgi:hypothetical protein
MGAELSISYAQNERKTTTNKVHILRTKGLQRSLSWAHTQKMNTKPTHDAKYQETQSKHKNNEKTSKNTKRTQNTACKKHYRNMK